MLDKALKAFRDLGDDEELGPADWPTVKGYITSLGDVEGGVHPYIVSENIDVLDPMDMKDIRIRLLNGIFLKPFLFWIRFINIIFFFYFILVLYFYGIIDLDQDNSMH